MGGNSLAWNFLIAISTHVSDVSYGTEHSLNLAFALIYIDRYRVSSKREKHRFSDTIHFQEGVQSLSQYYIYAPHTLKFKLVIFILLFCLILNKYESSRKPSFSDTKDDSSNADNFADFNDCKAQNLEKEIKPSFSDTKMTHLTRTTSQTSTAARLKNLKKEIMPSF